MAIGSGSEGAQTALQEHYKDDMSLAEAEVLALQTLKQVMEEKVRLQGVMYRGYVQGTGHACGYVAGVQRCPHLRAWCIRVLVHFLMRVASAV